jgi:hypothetical protein
MGRLRRPTAASLATFAAVGGAVAVVVWQFHPLSLLFLNTTEAGGDTGAHVDLPYYLEHHLLPHFRLTGWSPDWYDGYPIFTFYFPLPSLLVVLANLVLPYNVAFKLVTALGSFALPVAAWAFGRLWGARDPVPACLGVATLGFLFDRTFTIDGGNIASTLAGEYAFSISLALALVFLGLVRRGLSTGRYRAAAAVLLALTALSHLVPTMYAAAGAIILVLARPTRRRLWWGTSVALAGVAITGFWLIPFVWRLPYTTDMGFAKVTDYLHELFPPSEWWLLGLAAIGVALSVLRRNSLGIFLTALTVLSALGFRFVPQGKLYNQRLLPFFVLGKYLLAGIAVAEAGLVAAEGYASLRRRLAERAEERFWRSVGEDRWPEEAGAGARGSLAPALRLQGSEPPGPALPDPALPASPRARSGPTGGLLATVVTPLAFAAAAISFVALPLGLRYFPANAPGLRWFRGLPAADQSFVPDWIRWNYTGYQGKAAWPEYHALMTTMADLGRTYGCGRAMWEYGPELNDLGTPMALMLLPFWTHGCIDSMEGLLFESSATTPFHFLNQAELSAEPSEAMRGLPYGPLDVPLGVQHLQLLGVRYYMAFTPEAEAQAGADPALELVARSGPWPTALPDGQVVRRTWDIYLVHGAKEVVSLSADPVVVRGIGSERAWLDAVVPWYLQPDRWGVLLAERGPPGWARVRAGSTAVPLRPVVPAGVTGVRTSATSVTFDVRHTGSPVLVKVSYFPNWQASGAKGPYRVSPNLMVVVPTSHRVVLHYGYTPVDVLGWLVTAGGMAGAVVLAWRGPLRAEAPAGSATSGSATPCEPVPAELAGVGAGGPEGPGDGVGGARGEGTGADGPGGGGAGGPGGGAALVSGDDRGEATEPTR